MSNTDRSGAASGRCDETAADARAAKSVVRELEKRVDPMLATLVKDTADTKHNFDLHVKKQVRVPCSARGPADSAHSRPHLPHLTHTPDILQEMSLEATGRRLDYLYRKADEAVQARADLDACRATVADAEKTVACEQHTTSTLVCRMQVRIALPTQLHIRTQRWVLTAACHKRRQWRRP